MKEHALKILNKAQQAGAQDAELYIEKSKELTVQVRNGDIEAIETAMPVGVGLRVIKDGRQGFSYASSLEDLDIVQRAVSVAGYVAPDPFFQVAEQLPGEVTTKDIGIYDEQVAQLTTNDCLERALALEKDVYSRDKRITKTESAGFFTVISEEYVFNSKQVTSYQHRSLYGASAEVIAEQGGQSEAGGSYRMYRNLSEYDQEFLATNAAEDAALLLGAQGVASGKYQIILPGKVSRQFLGLFSQSFMADNFQKGKSMFGSQLGEKVLPSELSIIDDALLPRGLGSGYYDGEGLRGQTTTVVKDGVFEQLLYDSYTARKDGVSSTANGQRGFKSVPSVGINNFYLASSNPVDDVYAGFEGLVITRVMGLHTANPITGEFSFGASGYWVKDGENMGGRRNLAVAGNLKDLFNNILEVGQEPLFIGSAGCPDLKVDKVSVAGE